MRGPVMNATMIFRRWSHRAVVPMLGRNLIDQQLKRDGHEPLFTHGGDAAKREPKNYVSIRGLYLSALMPKVHAAA